MAEPTADVLVAFGITGDLAKTMTFRSHYRLEGRGLLHWRIIGVAADDWTTARLRRHLRESIKASGSYLEGDFADPATFARVATAIENARRPVFYLETPPSLFGAVVTGLARAGLTANARVVIEKPFGHDLASAKALAAELYHSISEEQIFRVDHFLGKLGFEELLYLRYANTILDPVWDNSHVSSIQITMAERFGVEDRGRFYDAVGTLRDVVVNHLLQLTAAATMEPPREGETLEDARHRLLRSMADADPARYVRGQYNGYRATPGVASRSTTETYCGPRAEDRQRALARRADPHSNRKAASGHPDRGPPDLPRRLPLTFLARRKQPSANELVVRIDPKTGIRMILEAHRADASGPEAITLDMEFAEQGGEGPTPYEVLFEAALTGDRTLFIRQETVEEAWRVIQPLLDANPRTHSYRQGSWGPAAANRLLGDRDAWRRLWPV